MNFLADVWTALVLLFLLVLTCRRTVVEALSCYQCNSYKDKDCEGSNLEHFKAPCKFNAVGCRKIIYKLDVSGHGMMEERTVRQCSKTRGNTKCTSEFGTNGKRYKQFTCECSGDFCNRSARMTVPPTILCLVALLSVVMIILNAW